MHATTLDHDHGLEFSLLNMAPYNGCEINNAVPHSSALVMDNTRVVMMMMMMIDTRVRSAVICVKGGNVWGMGAAVVRSVSVLRFKMQAFGLSTLCVIKGEEVAVALITWGP